MIHGLAPISRSNLGVRAVRSWESSRRVAQVGAQSMTLSTIEGNELRRNIALFLRWSAFLALPALLAGGSAYLITARQPPLYRANTLLIVEQLGVGQGSYSDVLASNQSVATYVDMVAQPVVLNKAASQVPGASAKDLANRVHASSETGTSLIQLQVDDTSPTRAAALADAIATTFISMRQASAQTAFQNAQQELGRQIEDMQSQENSISDQISGLQTADPSSPRLPTLRQQLSALVARQIAQENVSSQLTQQ